MCFLGRAGDGVSFVQEPLSSSAALPWLRCPLQFPGLILLPELPLPGLCQPPVWGFHLLVFLSLD